MIEKKEVWFKKREMMEKGDWMNGWGGDKRMKEKGGMKEKG